MESKKVCAPPPCSLQIVTDACIILRVTTFDLTLTTAAFPTPTFENNFYKTHNISKTIGVAVLQVFYSTLEKHLVAERPKYEDLATLVSNIGGIGGAYLGLSLIALTEFLDIISQAAMKMIF
ncbi:uncharacterized protein LOC135116102 [Scylla paramamosain]|uniref:uncharacterized protein LOC135116102 n=1 Tax=Scylla paramamosain TaxID=85552 RepID=UPI003082AC91